MAERVKQGKYKILLVWILRIAVSGLFLSAGVLKLKDPNATLVAVYQYKLLSWEGSGAVATFLPFLEITAAIGLWIPRVRVGASAMCIALCLIFIGALGSAVARNLDVSCGCFGTTDLHTQSARRLIEDVILLLMCLPLLRHALSKHSERLHSEVESGN
jgi:uncharacterized membrane protein YphA (DoxX/SURF4 family)